MSLFARNVCFAALVGRPINLPTLTVEEIAKQFEVHPATVKRALASLGIRPDGEPEPEAEPESEADRLGRLARNARRRRAKPQPRYSDREDAV